MGVKHTHHCARAIHNCKMKLRYCLVVYKQSSIITVRLDWLAHTLVPSNEIKYDYVDSKQHFYLQYHVAATDMKELCKKQTTFQAVAYLGFPAPGDKLRRCPPAHSWHHKKRNTAV